MNIVKLLSIVFLGLYLIMVGLVGMGVFLFIPAVLTSIFALVAGVLFLIWGVKACCRCKSCDHNKPCEHHEKPNEDNKM